jgi:NADP oxidoreductase coenzyme F420-dependent
METIIGVILKLSMRLTTNCVYSLARGERAWRSTARHLRTPIASSRSLRVILTSVFSKLAMAATPSGRERRSGELGFSKNRKDRPMRIGTIGAGEVALAVAREAIARGHDIVLSSRSGPDALADKVSELGRGASAATVEQAASLDYVLLAVPWKNGSRAIGSHAGRDPRAAGRAWGSGGSEFDLAVFRSARHQFKKKPCTPRSSSARTWRVVNQHRTVTPTPIPHKYLVLNSKKTVGWGPDRRRSGPHPRGKFND